MIVVKIIGGLGNQLFQYAVGKSLATKKNTSLLLDLSSYAEEHYRSFRLCYFNINITPAEPKNIPYHKKDYRPNKFLSVQSRLFTFSTKIYNEKHFHFDKNVLNLKSPCYLYGYWQSEKYFESIKSVLLQEFQLSTSAEINENPQMEQIKNTNSVAIHVRRGDYQNDVNLYILPIGYYQKAITIISEQVQNPAFFVFSDDIEWCKKNINLNAKLNYIENNKDIQDFEMMKECKHHIIANSTFSWWAAYLSEFTKGITIAPLNWFKPTSKHSSDDLYLKSWIVI